jgi:transcriptional regulator with XRE-family HTH domain
MNLSDVGKKIKQLRMQMGLTQSQLAEKVNISYQQIQKYEKGESQFNISRFLEIARALEIAPGQLFDNLFNQKIREPAGHYHSDKNQELKVTPEEKKLVAYYRGIKKNSVRNHILKLLKSISEINSENGS